MTLDEILKIGDFASLKTDRTCELEVLKTMLIHSQEADPSGVIIKRHPSEDEETFRWRLDNYTCITKPVFDRACNALNRIFADSKADWSISSATEVFLERKRFDGVRFEHFLQKHVLKVMLEDPNAWLVTHPRLPVPEQINQKVDVDISLVRTTHQFHKSKTCIIWCEEPVYDLGKKRTLGGAIMQYNSAMRAGAIPTNTYYHVITSTEYAIIFLRKSDDSSINVPQLVAKYDHQSEDLLYTPLGGKLTINNCYESYFASFVAFGNDALRSYSDYRLIAKNSAYPIKEMRSIDCAAEGCRSGAVYDASGTYSHVCSSCKGSGKQIRFSPSSIIFRPEVDANSPGPVDSSPMLQYHSPDIGILNAAREDWTGLLDMAVTALNLNFVLEAQSGVAKNLDRQELYSMVAEIGHNIYDALIYDALYRMEKLRERAYAAEPVIIKPSHYNIDTEDRLNEQFQFFSQVKGLAFVKTETFKRAMHRMHSGNPKVLKIIDALIEIDPFITNDLDDLALAKTLGTATDFDIFVSTRANSVLRRLIEERDREIKSSRIKGDNVKDYLMSSPVSKIVDDLRDKLRGLFQAHKSTLEADMHASNGNQVDSTDYDVADDTFSEFTNDEMTLFNGRLTDELSKRGIELGLPQ